MNQNNDTNTHKNGKEERLERDSIGTIAVASKAYWGAQTQRSLQHFSIGNHQFTSEFIRAFAITKKAAAFANHELGKLSIDRRDWICMACDEIIKGKFNDQFPLSVWQTGSGTQTNMNVNEVISNRANELAGGKKADKSPVHPNDHVNMSQSSNDVFPTVMHITTVNEIFKNLLPAIDFLEQTLSKKVELFSDIVKTGRTHLMDAAPITLGQEFSAYLSQVQFSRISIQESLPSLQMLAIGGTAVGTGLNTHPEWPERIVGHISEMTGISFKSAPNKFMAIAGHDALVLMSSKLRLLATVLFKMANDIRLLGSGPRCGLAELKLPANEPGSSIMPGKNNPTQAEALTMIAIQVIGNDTAIGMAGSQGHLDLNVFKPLIIHNLLESIRLLADGCFSFTQYCLLGIEPNLDQIENHLNRSLVQVAALGSVIGYDKAAQAGIYAVENDTSLRQAVLQLKLMSEEEFDSLPSYKDMLGPNKIDR